MTLKVNSVMQFSPKLTESVKDLTEVTEINKNKLNKNTMYAIGVSGPKRGVYRAPRRRGLQSEMRRRKKDNRRGHRQKKTKTR